MGIVKEQRKKIESLEAKVGHWKKISNIRTERAQKAEAALAAAERMIGILILQAGGKVEIEDDKWRGAEVEVVTRYDQDELKTIFEVKMNS